MVRMRFVVGVALAVVAACARGGEVGPDGGDCVSPDIACPAGCVNITNDPDNCGTCNVVCTSGQVCSAGKCGASCGGGGTLCTPDGGKPFCASLSSDTKNCGGCGVTCNTGGTCTSGKCQGGTPTCPSGQTSCAGTDGGPTCVDTQTNGDHCGTCTNQCLPTVQTCNEGACVSACTGGKTLCIPDGGAGDGGPVAHCADLQNDAPDCGTCFHACAGGATCALGVCKSNLLGSGTAADPWHTASPLANCSAYHTAFPTATDGVYTTHPKSADIGVYCDMTHGGVTYEDFGMGKYTVTYTGYTWVGSSDFTGTTQFDEAFAYLFTRNGGLNNIDVGFTSGNCCFINNPATSQFGVDGATYMYPGAGSSFTCSPSGGYTASVYPLYLVTAAKTISSITSAQAGSVGTYTSCSASTNPAIFVKRY